MEEKLLVLVIMVKDEATVIEKTLQPFVEAGVRDIMLLDTGSTDDTINVTKKFFESNHVNGVIEQEPFVDFSTSRNRAMEYAEKHFPDAVFFFMLDANWDTKNVSKLIEFCEEYKNHSDLAYAVRVYCGPTCEFRSTRLFRANAKIRYTGSVHESPDQPPSVIPIYDDVVCLVSDDYLHRRKSKQRFERDLYWLSKDLKKNPANSRALFYIAQTYECLGDLTNAYKFYFKRSAIRNPINIPEDSVTFFRLGYLVEHLAQTNSKYTWEMAMEHYMKSFSVLPTRIEGLVAIASYYINKFPQISFLYLKYACSVPYPSDSGFIVKNMYDFTRYDLMSRIAFVMGEVQIGKEATESALKAQPDNFILRQRLQLYENEIQQRNNIQQAADMPQTNEKQILTPSISEQNPHSLSDVSAQ